MRIAICDDNMNYISIIENYINKFKKTAVECDAYTSGWINVNKVDSKKRKNYTDISNASFWLGVRPLLCE
jgi:hypothetical protein